jgi:hypothetical protein
VSFNCNVKSGGWTTFAGRVTEVADTFRARRREKPRWVNPGEFFGFAASGNRMSRSWPTQRLTY